MSLINQVLQDLQQRHAAGADTTNATLRDVRVTTPYDKRPVIRPWMLWGMILVLAGVSIALLLPRIQARFAPPLEKTATPTASSHTTVRPPQTISNPAPPISETPAAPVQAHVATPAATPVAEIKANVKAEPSAVAPSPAPAIVVAPIVSPRTEKTPPLTPPPPHTATVAKTLRALAPEQQADLDYLDAQRLMQSGRPSAAEPRLRAALAALPEHQAARTSLAALLINAGRLSEARALLSAGVEKAPTYAPLAKLYARLLIDANDLVTARAVLERAAPPVQADPDYHALLAALYQRAGLYEQAAQTYRGALQIQPRNGVWWLGLGLALEGGGDTASALQAYQHAQQSGTLAPEVLRYVETKLATLH